MHMKKLMKNLCVTVLLALLTLSLPVCAYADASTGDTSYTYNLDYWGDVQDSPDFYTVSKVVTSSDLQLDVKMKSPEGLFMYKDLLYVCDTGNNRILELQRVSEEELKLVRIIDSFSGAENNTFSAPTDIAISEEGNFFIADKGNARVLKLDKDLNYLMEF